MVVGDHVLHWVTGVNAPVGRSHSRGGPAIGAAGFVALTLAIAVGCAGEDSTRIGAGVASDRAPDSPPVPALPDAPDPATPAEPPGSEAPSVSDPVGAGGVPSAGAGGRSGSGSSGSAGSGAEVQVPGGLDARPPAARLSLPGIFTAAAPGWILVEAYPGLEFNDPISFVEAPGSGRIVVTERQGRVYAFANDASTTEKRLLLDLSDRTQGEHDCGLLGVAFHPEFGE